MTDNGTVCIACQETIRAGAKKCPHCHQLQTGIAKIALGPVGSIIGIMLIVAILVWLAFTIKGLVTDHDLNGSFIIGESRLAVKTDEKPTKVSCIADVKNTGSQRWSDFWLQAKYFNGDRVLVDVHNEVNYISVYPLFSFTARVTGAINGNINDYDTCEIFITAADDY